MIDADYRRAVEWAARNGAKIEGTRKGINDWSETQARPYLNWDLADYRVAEPEKAKLREWWIMQWKSNKEQTAIFDRSPTEKELRINSVTGWEYIHVREVLPE